MSTNAETRCRFPGCDLFVKARGLCVTHHNQATRSKGALREEALKYLLPSQRGPRAKSPGQRATPARRTPEASADAAARRAPGAPGRKRRKTKTTQDEVQERIVDASISSVTEFATFMEIRRYPLSCGFLLVNEQNDKKVILTRDGELREATLTIGSLLHGGAAEMEPVELDT